MRSSSEIARAKTAGSAYGAGAGAFGHRQAWAAFQASLWKLIAGIWGAAFLVTFLSTPAGASFLEEAELRAILFNRARADTLGVPLVLLAHRTHADMKGNGARQIDEHFVWYVRDPHASGVDRIAESASLIDRSIEAFGLRRFRVIRDADTLSGDMQSWQPFVPRGWPEPGGDPWREIRGNLPPLEPGDVVEVAYSIVNPGSRTRVPSDWERILLRSPWAPTVDRQIIVTYNRSSGGTFKVVGEPRRLTRHLGSAVPMVELLTGNLPPGPDDADSLLAPALLFTSSTEWWPARRAVAEHYYFEITQAQAFLGALGDSLMRAHRDSRDRAEAVIRMVDERCARIPYPLIASSYYPRSLAVAWQERTADAIDRALLIAALAQASTLRTDLLLGRSTPEGFDPIFVSPMQFDRFLVRFFIAEDDSYVLADTWESDLDDAIAAVPPDVIMVGLSDELAKLFTAAGGELVDYVMP